MSSESPEHSHPHVVGFGECDPAGIMYFPRFFDLFHQTMESWFSAIGLPYADLIRGRRLGFPAVHTEADFRRPSQFGERLDIRLRVLAVGRRSLELGYRVCGPQEPGSGPRVTGRTVCAVMDLDPDRPMFGRAVELPADLRASIDRFRSDGATH
ncbi:MAG: acyl-CoA thioesterase [Nannocystaceae bacterium]